MLHKTYLAYLTDNPGQFIMNEKSYPISKGNIYIFPEDVSHETIETGLEPRLLLGPMNERGLSVGGGNTIRGNFTVEQKKKLLTITNYLYKNKLIL